MPSRDRAGVTLAVMSSARRHHGIKASRGKPTVLLVLVLTFPAEATFAGGLAGPVTSIKLGLGFTALLVTLVSLLALGFKTLYNRRTAKHEHQ